MAGKARRHYGDEERASALAALAANGGNIKRTANQLGIPEKTLSNWAKGISHPESAINGDQKKGNMADALEAVAWKLIEVMPTKVSKATLSQVATSLGIAIDKMRLLREQATSISGQGGLTDEQRLECIREVLERVRRRRLGVHDTSGANGDRQIPAAEASLDPSSGAAGDGAEVGS
jgi:hypothetical protein